TGEITGTYRSTQSSSITVLVQDQGGQSVQRTFAIQANQPPPPQGTIGGLPQNPAPSLQPTATLTIASPFPLEITGTLTLTFAPNAAVNADDPTIRFANNTRTINFRIPAGQTQAIFEGSPAFQTGSTAGTITLTAALNSGGQSVTTTQTVVIPRSAPTITSATAQRSGNTITLTVTGFSTTRDITAMTLRLTGAASTNLQTTELTPPVTQAFATWFGSTQGQSFGSEFRLSIPLTVEGDAATAITGIQVVLTNSAGSSSPTNATIQ
ncbi:MAG TPA: hypothetical protein VE621_09415, partial [Bryobacteraceae bacterium]|nr:hypothetical protein [Bryobacteraceae bacterium]